MRSFTKTLSMDEAAATEKPASGKAKPGYNRMASRGLSSMAPLIAIMGAVVLASKPESVQQSKKEG